MKRRILSIITALVLCLGLLPGTALAADTNPVLDISNGSIWIKDGHYAQAKTVTAPAAWTDYTGETRTVDMHIRTLRQKLGGYGAMIQTVRNVGYRLEGKP